MIYALIIVLMTGTTQEVEVRVPFKTHEDCIAAADEIVQNVKRYSFLFGAKVNTSGCYKT